MTKKQLILFVMIAAFSVPLTAHASVNSKVYLTIKDLAPINAHTSLLKSVIWAEASNFLNGYIVPQRCHQKQTNQCKGDVLEVQLLPSGNLSQPGQLSHTKGHSTIKIKRHFQHDAHRQIVIAHEIAHYLILQGELPLLASFTEELLADYFSGELLAASSLVIPKNLEKEALALFKTTCPNGHCGPTHGAVAQRIKYFEQGVDNVETALRDAKQRAVAENTSTYQLGHRNLNKSLPVIKSYYSGNFLVLIGNQITITSTTSLSPDVRAVLVAQVPKDNAISTGPSVELKYQRRIVPKGKWHTFNQPNIQNAAKRKAQKIVGELRKSIEKNQKPKS